MGCGTRSKKALIVDDEPLILETLQYGLRPEGYVTSRARSGQEALAHLHRQQADVVLLDVEMPEMDGWETCRRIRALSSVPIIMVTIKASEEDVIRGLDAGADDYVTKPIRMPVLQARVRAVLRRHHMDESGPVERVTYDGGRLAIDHGRKQVEVEGRVAPLSPLEFKLLEYLAANWGRVLSLRQILEHVWGPEYVNDTHYVKVYVNTIRRKLEEDPRQPQYIITRPGFGYEFRAPRVA